MLQVGLCEWKITIARPILTITFKNILRIFKAEILKIFRNIQPQPKNYTFLIKKKKKECIVKITKQFRSSYFQKRNVANKSIQIFNRSKLLQRWKKLNMFQQTRPANIKFIVHLYDFRVDRELTSSRIQVFLRFMLLLVLLHG